MQVHFERAVTVVAGEAGTVTAVSDDSSVGATFRDLDLWSRGVVEVLQGRGFGVVVESESGIHFRLPDLGLTLTLDEAGETWHVALLSPRWTGAEGFDWHPL